MNNLILGTCLMLCFRRNWVIMVFCCIPATLSLLFIITLLSYVHTILGTGLYSMSWSFLLLKFQWDWAKMACH